MVDSVSGNAASGLTRQAAQVSNGRLRPEPQAGASALSATQLSASPLSAKPGSARPTPVVSEGRDAVRMMAAEPPVNAARVADLRSAITSGNYPIKADLIADAMIRSEKGVSGR